MKLRPETDTWTPGWVACVADVSTEFLGEEMEQASKQTSALLVSKNAGEPFFPQVFNDVMIMQIDLERKCARRLVFEHYSVPV